MLQVECSIGQITNLIFFSLKGLPGLPGRPGFAGTKGAFVSSLFILR